MAEILARPEASVSTADTIAIDEVATLAAPAHAPIQPAGRPRTASWSRRWVAACVGAVLVVGLAAAALRHVTDTEAPTAPPSYPAVEGDLGDALTSLQQSVVP